MRDQLEAWGFGAESSPEELREALWEADILRRDRWVFYGQQAESREELLVVEKTPFMDHRLVDQVAVVEEPGQPESCQVEIDSSQSSQVAAEREGERLGQRRVVMLMDGELLWVGRLGQLFDDEGQVRLSSPFNQRGAVASAGRPLLGGSHVWNDDGQVHDSESVYSWCQAMVGSLHTGPLDHPLRVLDLEAVDAVQ